MKTAKEIMTMLVRELVNHIDKIRSSNQKLGYYNKILGDTSFLLAGLLESLLKEKYKDWNREKWIDDCLISKIKVENDNLSMMGTMIWGRQNTTEQWTDPFYFEMELLRDKMDFKRFMFLFCDLDNPEITFEEFRANRGYWEKSNRNWKYIINSDASVE